MKYILMHKETPVVLIDIDEDVCVINKIEEIYNEAHLPVGIHIANGIVDRAELNHWWLERSIPANRIGIKEVLESLNISNTRIFLTKCYGLSLSDQYWIRPVDREDLHWRDINFLIILFLKFLEMYYLVRILTKMSLILTHLISQQKDALKSDGKSLMESVVL